MSDDLIKLYRDQQDALGGGCGDGHCVIKKPVGMRTNGGCRCLYNLDFMGRQRVGVMLKASQEMADRIEQLERERDHAWSMVAKADGDAVRAAGEALQMQIAKQAAEAKIYKAIVGLSSVRHASVTSWIEKRALDVLIELEKDK